MQETRTSGILTHQISDHFMTFGIVESNIKHNVYPIYLHVYLYYCIPYVYPVKYVEV